MGGLRSDHELESVGPRQPSFESRIHKLDVGKPRQPFPCDPEQLRSGIEGNNRKASEREVARRLSGAATDLKDRVTFRQTGVRDDILEERFRIIRTSSVIEKGDAI